MENHIKIEHFPTSFNERVKYFGSIFLFLFFFLVAITLIRSGYRSKFDFSFLLISSSISGLLFLYKIHQTRKFLVDFESDSNYVKITYLRFNTEKHIETTIDEIEIYLINTSSRAGFDCELKLKLKNLNFRIDKNFEWDFEEMKKMFEFIKFHKNIKPSEKDLFTLSRIDHYIQKNQN